MPHDPAKPSPASNYLSLNRHLEGGMAELYDLSGKMVRQETLVAEASTIDVSTLAGGVYLLRVQTALGHSSQKVMIQ